MRTACCGFCGALLNFSALIKMKSQTSQQLLSSGRMTCRVNFGEIIFFFFFEKLWLFTEEHGVHPDFIQPNCHAVQKPDVRLQVHKTNSSFAADHK